MKTFGKVIAIIGVVMFLGICAVIVLGYLLLRDLGAHYEKEAGKVYWVRGLSHEFRQTRRDVPDADFETFQVLSSHNSRWASDKNHVYFEGRVLRSADPNDFEVFDRDNELSRSGDNEYKRARKIRNDVEKFVDLGSYSLDINGVYWAEKVMPGADPGTFKQFDMPETEYSNSKAWALDETGVYCNGRRLKGSDPATFRLLGFNYGVDKHRVYHEFNPLPQANRETFVVTYHETKYVIGYDGTQIWVYEKPVPATEEQKKLVRAEQ